MDFDKARFLNEKEVSSLTGISLAKLRKDRCEMRGFPYSKIGSCVRYAFRDVVTHMEANRVEPRRCAHE